VGELRVIVARSCQRKGLGMLMARELYQLAVIAKVEEMLVKMMKPQVGAQKIFHKLGFRKVATLPQYVKDVKGNRQDLIIMRCPLASLWESLDLYFDVTDWRGRGE
jgi:L-amino acid N-acyltransferase YncA